MYLASGRFCLRAQGLIEHREVLPLVSEGAVCLVLICLSTVGSGNPSNCRNRYAQNGSKPSLSTSRSDPTAPLRKRRQPKLRTFS